MIHHAEAVRALVFESILFGVDSHAPQRGQRPAVFLLVAILAGGAPAAAQEVSARRLQLPREDLPASFRVEVEHEGRSKVLLLQRRSVRSSTFRMLVQKAGGELVEAPAPAPRTYVGSIEGEPETLVAASLLPDGLRATVLPPEAEAWHVKPLRESVQDAPREAYVVHSGDDIDLPDLSSDMVQPPEAAVASNAGAERGSGAADGECLLKEAEIAFDSDYEFFNDRCGGDSSVCVATIEDGLNTINRIYVRDLKIIHKLTTIIVREDPDADFYAQFPDASDFGAMLSAFRKEWNANMSHVPHDMAYYVTGKGHPEYGGLAYVSTTCGSYAYGMGLGYSGFVAILRHELGHNWSASHSCGLERRYIMCGNSIDAFSGYNIEKITKFRDSRDCLDDVEYESDPEPPYARPDFVRITAGDGPVAIDVLGSDTDRNCEELRIASYDARSSFGAEITPVDGIEGETQDALLYAPRSNFVGTDTFRYVVEDESGFEVPATVYVHVAPRALVGYYGLDETSGDVIVDSSGEGNDGELRGGLSPAEDSVPGKLSRALHFDGVTDHYISIGDDSSLDLASGLTISAWFTADSFDHGGETLVGKGSSAWRLKRDGSRSTLKFTCSGTTGREAKGSVSVADGQWHHAAGVYDGRRIALYVDGVLDASVTSSGSVHTNSDNVHIGDNGWNGKIDEVRIYNHALTAEEVLALFRGGGAANPSPHDGRTGVNPGESMSWIGSASATDHDVYLGTDRNTVASADRTSSEYLGRRSGTSLTPDLEPGQTYYWRVDEVAGGGILEGNVWSFTTSFAFTNFDEPSLNASNFSPRPTDVEIGFSTTSASTGGANPFAGVIETGSINTSPIFAHRSLAATTTFDAVDLSGHAGALVSLVLQARGTGYEAEDFLEVHVTNSAESIGLVRTDAGPDLNQLAGAGYRTFAASIPADWDEARLVLKSSSNSSHGSERFDFDTVGFSCWKPYRVIAQTHFQEPAAGSASYTPGAGGTELGFVTARTPTGGAAPLAGVVDVGTSPGARSLVMRSVSSTTTFDTVDLPAAGGVVVQVVLRVRDTGYEASDFLDVHATSGGEKLELIRATGSTGLGELAGDHYRSYRARIPDSWREATLVLKTSSNSSAGSEEYDLRAVEFVSTDVDDPCGSAEPPPVTFRRGDANTDGQFDLSDGVAVLNYLFLGSADLNCLDAADSDDNGSLDLTDGIGIFNHLFLGAEPPPEPGASTCGPDPTDDALSCDNFPGCRE